MIKIAAAKLSSFTGGNNRAAPVIALFRILAANQQRADVARRITG
jgi:hypothetical protein